MWIDLVFRPEAFSETLAESIRERIWSVDPDHFIEIYMNGDGPPIWFARTRFVATLLVVFSVVAFTLSAAGVFSVVSFQIGRRKREMGIRKAVGATNRDLHRLVVGGALRQASIGIVIGLVAAMAVTPFLEELLYWHRTHGWTHDVGRDTRSRRGRARRELHFPVRPLTRPSPPLDGLAADGGPGRRLSRIHPADVLRSD